MNDGLAQLLACVAAFGQSLQATFDPRLFLDDLSARAQRLVPHHRMPVPYLEDDDGTATVFAEHSADDVLFREGRYTTDFDPAGRYAHHQARRELPRSRDCRTIRSPAHSWRLDGRRLDRHLVERLNGRAIGHRRRRDRDVEITATAGLHVAHHPPGRRRGHRPVRIDAFNS
jgi:hypothetical protein